MDKQIKICWNSHKNEFDLSLIDLVENNSLELKKKYIEFIFQISQNKLSKKIIYTNLNVYDNFSLWWMSIIHEKNFYKSKSIEFSLRIFALYDFLENNHYKNIYISEVPKLCKRSLLSIQKKLNLNIIIKYENNFKNLGYKNIIKKILPRLVLGAFTITKYYIKSFKYKYASKPNNKYLNSKNNILIISYLLNFDKDLIHKNIFKSDYWGDLPKLLKKSKYSINWLHIFGDEKLKMNEINNISKLNLDKSLNEKHYFLESNFKLNNFINVIINYLYLYFKNLNLFFGKKIFLTKDTKIDLWSLYKDEWRDSIFGSLSIRNLLIYNLFQSQIKLAQNNKIIFYLHEGLGWEKAMINSFRKKSKIIGVIQSPIRNWDIKLYDFLPEKFDYQKLSYFSAHKLAINSEFGFNLMSEINSNISMVKVEPLRAKMNINKYKNYNSLRKNDKKQVLILGGYLHFLTNELLNNIYLLKNKYQKNNFEFKFRLHPGNNINSIVNNNDLDKNNDIYKTINNSDIIIVTGDSSASVDAYNLNKKIIIYLGNKYLNINSLRSFMNVEIARNIDDLKKSIYSLSKKDLNKNDSLNNYYYFDENYTKWKDLIKN